MFANAKVVSQIQDQQEAKTSVAALDATRRGLISGIIRSIAMHVFVEFPDPKVQKAKILTVVNAMRAGNDISEDEGSWLANQYFDTLKPMSVSSDSSCCVAPCSPCYFSWWMCVNNLIEDTHVYEWSFSSETLKTLNDSERKLVEDLKTFQEKYWKARTDFENYFRKVNTTAFRQILLKYGTTLAQVVPKWYDGIKRSTNLEKETPTES